MERSAEMEKNIHSDIDILRGKYIASLFYAPSTRTRFSFELAMRRLGGHVLTADGFEFSSLVKGETVEDNTKVIGGYANVDGIVMRHKDAGSAARAASVSPVPFINAGDGNNEHPTQALLDLYTIQQECGRLSDLHVAFAGDLERGRTVHSLATLLSLYDSIRLTFATPGNLQLPLRIKNLLNDRGVKYEEVDSLEPVLDADIGYITRNQTERPRENGEAEVVEGPPPPEWIVTADRLRDRKTVIMHPLPRNAEIATDVDALPNAAYFRQSANGVPVRMALLATLLGK